MQNAKNIEVVLFTLNDGVSRESFLKNGAVVQAKLEQYAGYLHRQLLENGEGQWIDIVWWESVEHAHAAAEIIMQDTEVMPFMQAINEKTMQMFHLSPVELKTMI